MVTNGFDLLSAAPILDMEPVKRNRLGVSFGLGEAGYDIRLKQTVRFRSRFFGLIRWVEVQDVDTKKITYHRGRFALASALEYFKMPGNLVGVVHDKSTWARHGLSVFNTVIEPGWEGFLTLELVYHGNKDLTIYAGSGIGQVIFHQTLNQSHYNGKYQFQSSEPIPPRESEDHLDSLG